MAFARCNETNAPPRAVRSDHAHRERARAQPGTTERKLIDGATPVNRPSTRLNAALDSSSRETARFADYQSSASIRRDVVEIVGVDRVAQPSELAPPLTKRVHAVRRRPRDDDSRCVRIRDSAGNPVSVTAMEPIVDTRRNTDAFGRTREVCLKPSAGMPAASMRR